MAFPPCARPRPAPQVLFPDPETASLYSGEKAAREVRLPTATHPANQCEEPPKPAPWNPSSAASGYRTTQSLRFPVRKQPLSREKFPSSSSWDPRRHTAKEDGRGWEVRSHDAFSAVSVAVGRVRTPAGRRRGRGGRSEILLPPTVERGERGRPEPGGFEEPRSCAQQRRHPGPTAWV